MGEDIPVIGKVAALITDTGGITAHISTIAKECAIPCIVGTKDASKKLKDGMRVIVDADEGKVYSYLDKSVRKLEVGEEVVWLEGLKAKLNLVGAKAANLINLMQLKVNVPDACVITTEAFDKFLEENGLKKDVDKALSKIDTEELGDLEEKLQKKILAGKISKDLESKTLSSFKTLKSKYGSSATCEDSVKASFAGQFQSFLFVDDRDTLLESVKRCWASLFRAGAMLYSIKHGIDITTVKMAVIIQGMIDAEVAGVMFTKNLEGQEESILIEAAKGVGENVVSGEITPVSYSVSKESGRILDKEGGEDLLKASQVSKLVSLGKKIEESFGMAQDIEWAIVKDRIYILQSRPITT
jgi:phosphoenolpyruvate synthase/pyruvate phosphate dikinase